MGFAGVDHLVVSGLTLSPAAQIYHSPHGLAVNGCAISSLLVIMEALNVTSYSVIQAEGNVAGTVFENKSALGMSADVLYERADVTLQVSHLSVAGYKHLFASHHFLVGPYVIIGGSLKEGDTDITAYLKSFDFFTWILMFISLFSVSLISVAFHKFSSYHGMTDRGYRSVFSGVQQWFHQYFENLLLEASIKLPQGISLRILCAVWWLAVSIISNSFAGKIKSYLTAKHTPPRINPVQDLAAHRNIKPIMSRDSIVEHIFRRSENPFCKAVVERLAHCTDCRISGSEVFSDKVFEQVAREEAVLISSDKLVASYLAKFCRKRKESTFYVGKEVFATVRLMAYLRRTLPKEFLLKFNQLVRRSSEAAIMRSILDKAFRGDVSLKECSHELMASSLSLEEVWALGPILMCCGVICMIVFILEVISVRGKNVLEKMILKVTNAVYA